MSEQAVPDRKTKALCAGWWLVLVVLLAFVLRLYRIDAPCLRGDEAFSITYARQSLPQMLRHFTTSTEPHPPFSFFVLHYWGQVAGESEFALRFTSAFAGVLVVPLIYVLGRLLFGPRVGLAAAALLAFNPFYIWHAQEARMYAMLAAFSIASTILFLFVLGRRGWGWPLAYGAVTALGVYTHYYTFLLIAFQGVYAVLGMIAPRLRPLQHRTAEDLAARKGSGGYTPDWRPFARWLVGAVLTGLLYLPWFLSSMSILLAYQGSARSALPFFAPIYRSVLAFGQGQTLPQDVGLAFLPLWAGLFLGGMIVAWRRDRSRAFFALLSFLIPWTIVFIDSLQRPAFDERYFMVSSPPFYLFCGVSLLALYRWRRRAFALVAVLVVGVCAVSLYNHYHDPAYARAPDWRALNAFFTARVQRDDVVLANYPDPAAGYYFDFDVPWQVVPEAYPVDVDRTVATLDRFVSGRARIWLTPQRWAFWDADGLVESWLDEHAERAAEFEVDRFRVVRYDTPMQIASDMRPLDVQLEGGIRLLGYVLRDSGGDAVERIAIAPGEQVALTLYWETGAKLDEDYVVFAHVLDETGWLRGQQDNQPRQGRFPTPAWVPGERVVDVYRIAVAPESPPGGYAIEVGMYRPGDGTRLQTSGADADVENRRVLLRNMVNVTTGK
ncbi:MAG: glycosyltransferase family 39 protein [Anaerolineae bacterium]|nr:glycosyltransferase family 39 protein [Anaerolineae bacterium]